MTNDVGDDTPLPAGDFATWLADVQGAIRGDRGSDVPCNGCTACCTSSQFVHIAPDETETLARIPAELLFPAPGLPRGHVVVGYDQQGRCPMLADGRCSIYDHRPRTCRAYDCRIFAATGLADEAKPPVARRARRWRFGFPTPVDRTAYEALRAAARFLDERADVLPRTALPVDTTARAVLAIEIHALFLRRDDETGRTALVDPDPAVVADEVLRRAGMDRRGSRSENATVELDREVAMQASVGDRIIVHGLHVGDADRSGVIVEVHGKHGEPPYLVDWTDGHQGLYHPAGNARIEPKAGDRASG
jgi:Fe-S-cluster containining protein